MGSQSFSVDLGDPESVRNAFQTLADRISRAEASTERLGFALGYIIGLAKNPAHPSVGITDAIDMVLNAFAKCDLDAPGTIWLRSGLEAALAVPPPDPDGDGLPINVVEMIRKSA